jgi:hypothetical protein
MSIKRLSGAGLTTPKSNKLWDQTTFQSGMFALATISLTSAQSSIAFSGIPQNYTHLQVRGIARASLNSARIRYQFNGDTGANYSDHYIYSNGAGTPSASAGANISRLSGGYSDSTANLFSVTIIDILDYSSTSKYKTVKAISGTEQNDSNGELILWSGSWRSTSAITSILMNFDNSANITQYSHFALYGIKAA